MEIYEDTKYRYQLCLFLFSNKVDLKNNHRNYRKPPEFSRCANSCNKFVSSLC